MRLHHHQLQAPRSSLTKVPLRVVRSVQAVIQVAVKEERLPEAGVLTIYQRPPAATT